MPKANSGVVETMTGPNLCYPDIAAAGLTPTASLVKVRYMSTENAGSTAVPFTVTTSAPVTDGGYFTIPSTPAIDYLVEVVLHQHFNQLKARLMNLTEACLPENRQCNALKGLIKDVVNQCYYNSLREVNDNLRSRGVIPEGTDHSPVTGLDANCLSDILVD